MAYSGYPTPDLPEVQTFQEVCIYIPSSISDTFYQVLLGQISEMANEYYWKQAGTMSPEQAAFLWSQTLALTSADLEECSVMTCEEVADCIENNEAVQNALSNYMSGVGAGGTGNGGDVGAGANTTIVLTNNANDILAGGNCSNDNMYAVATRITELAFEAVNQLYQVIDLAQSPLELASELADNAPALVTAAPASAGDILIWVQNTAWNSWQVFDTSQRRIDVACDIFCIMVEQDCSLTFDDVFNYFAGKTVTAIFGVTLESIMLDMVDIFLTDEVGYTSLAFLFSMLSIGSKVAGIQNVGGFLTTIAAYIDESNNNWSLECDACAEQWCYSFDLTEFSLYDFSGGAGIQNMGSLNGSQWDSTDATASAGQGFMRGIAVRNVPAQSALINRVEIDYTAVEGTATGGAILNPARFMGLNGGSMQVDTQSIEIPAWGSGLTAAWDFSAVTVEDFRIWQNTDNMSSNNRIGSGNITAIRVFGEGTNPFGSDNC